MGALDMNISFTNKQTDYISDQVASGDYQNASEVVRDALRLHAVYRQKMIDELRTEIEKGWDAGVSNRSIADIITANQQQNITNLHKLPLYATPIY